MKYGIKISRTDWVRQLTADSSKILSFETRDEATEYAMNLELKKFAIQPIDENEG